MLFGHLNLFRISAFEFDNLSTSQPSVRSSLSEEGSGIQKDTVGVSKMMHPEHFVNSALQKISREFTGMTPHSLRLLLGTILAQPAAVQSKRTIIGQFGS